MYYIGQPDKTFTTEYRLISPGYIVEAIRRDPLTPMGTAFPRYVLFGQRIACLFEKKMSITDDYTVKMFQTSILSCGTIYVVGCISLRIFKMRHCTTIMI